MSSLQFRPRWIPSLATALGLVLFVQLGTWQWGKGERLAQELARREQQGQLRERKLDGSIVDAVTADAVRFVVRGQYDPAQQFFIDNRQHNGRPGVHVITPLKIENTQTWVLVNRGWTGWAEAGRQQLPEAPVPTGVVQVTGLAAVPSTKKFFLMPDRPEASPRLLERLEPQRFAAQVKQPVQPVVLLQDAANAQDGLVRDWPPPENRVPKHQSYAWQWFGMALALLCFYGYASFRRAPVQAKSSL